MALPLQELESEISTMIVEVLNLEEMSSNSIDPETPLFDGGLGLDSIDALEIGAAINRKYGIKLKSQDEDTRNHFESVRSLARFIESSGKTD
ncbi:MAG: acyl carrier protein [Gammaproteobacteria bacterium]|nr:acyl carrier protein [Gammaproteobacteria bacterium]